MIMRKIYNTLLMTLLLLVAGSCNQTQDEIFKESSAVRVQQQIDALSTALAAHPNGWSVDYFYGSKEVTHGGTTLLWKFDATNSTVVASSVFTGVDKTFTSNYTIKDNGGALLTFDTYNEAIHYFSDPIPPNKSAGDNLGLEGDFEFIVQSITDSKIVLISSKYRTPIIMTPIADDADWTTLLGTAKAAANQILAPSYEFYLNGELLAAATISDYVLDMEIPIADTENTFRIAAPILPKEGGFETMKPFSFTQGDENPTVQHFTYNADELRFVCSDEGVDFYIQKIFPPINERVVNMDDLYLFGFTINGSGEATYERMSPAIEQMLKDAQAHNGSEKLNLAGFGKNPWYPVRPGAQAFVFMSHDGNKNWGFAFSYVISPVADTTDQVTFGSFAFSLNAKYYTHAFTYFIKPIALAAPYKVVSDDPSVPTQFTFTSVSNPDIWFTIKK